MRMETKASTRVKPRGERLLSSRSCDRLLWFRCFFVGVAILITNRLVRTDSDAQFLDLCPIVIA